MVTHHLFTTLPQSVAAVVVLKMEMVNTQE
jgi:hypothetical protein